MKKIKVLKLLDEAQDLLDLMKQQTKRNDPNYVQELTKEMALLMGQVSKETDYEVEG